MPKQMISTDSGLPECRARGRCAINLVSGVKEVTPMPFTKRCLSSLSPAEIPEAAEARRISLAEPRFEIQLPKSTEQNNGQTNMVPAIIPLTARYHNGSDRHTANKNPRKGMLSRTIRPRSPNHAYRTYEAT